ncbi:hypothetical protein WJT86_05975 [Microvirga sp. W0021]|uniref:DUF2232 domain-containing protein n=1 Tax=Hohaiivirga grylli TaxID=3133970 RepID=A0ABV0BJZ9_9HYPH
MNTNFLIGILAGLVTALLASPLLVPDVMPVSVLVYFTPFPIFFVSLAWRHQTGLIASLVGALALMLPTQNFSMGMVMLVGIGLPSWGLAYLLLLGRQTNRGMEWYPFGNILFCLVLIASALVAAILLVGSNLNYENYTAYINAMLDAAEPALKESFQDNYDHDKFFMMLHSGLPSLQTSVIFLTLFLNLWLANRIASRTKRMPRPRVFVPATRIPPAIMGIAFIGIALAFMDGLFGLIGLGIRSAVYLALFIQGLMFIHFATPQKPGRGLILTAVYLTIGLTTALQTTVLIYALVGLGVVDILFNIRSKFGPANPAAPQ